MASVIPPDLELFLTGWLRSNITDVAGLQVGNRIPDGYDGSYPLVVVRDDGGTQSADRVTFDRSIGVNVAAASAPSCLTDATARTRSARTRHGAATT